MNLFSVGGRRESPENPLIHFNALVNVIDSSIRTARGIVDGADNSHRLAVEVDTSHRIVLDLLTCLADHVACGANFTSAYRMAENLGLDIHYVRNYVRSRPHTHAAQVLRDLNVVSIRLERLRTEIGEPTQPVGAIPTRLIEPKVRPMRAARSLADLTTRVLPARHRIRYRDEYRSELHELALSGASRWQQLACALRLLDRAWVLRAELREAALKSVRP